MSHRPTERERETTPVCRRSVKGTGRPVSHVGPVPPAATGWQCWRSEFSDRAHSNCCGNNTPLTAALAAASSRLSCARWRTISPSAASPAAPGRVPGGVGPTTPAPSDRQDRWCPLSRIQPRGSRAGGRQTLRDPALHHRFPWGQRPRLEGGPTSGGVFTSVDCRDRTDSTNPTTTAHLMSAPQDCPS